MTSGNTDVAGHLINGSWSSAGVTDTSSNPARPAEPVGQFANGDSSTASDAVSAAADALSGWAATPFTVRAELLEAIGAEIDRNLDALALLCTQEEGKTLAESRGEVQIAAETFRFQAALAKTSTEKVYPSRAPGETIRTVRGPLGVVGVITPWNFPVLIPAWKIAPALAAGNTVVWKPAEDTPVLSVELAKIMQSVGLPDGVLNLLLGDGVAGAALVNDHRVDGVTFTGSVPVGQSIRDAVTSRNGRVQLELGGHNPALVFDDADLDLAIPQLVSGAMGATGQKCTATRRVICTPGIYDQVVERMAAGVRELKVGDGQDPESAIGPLISPEAHAQVAQALDAAIAEGAEVVATTSQMPDSDGSFFTPTLLTGNRDLTIATEEVFGPISTVMQVDTDDEAFALANDTAFGLSAAVYTNDHWRIARALDTLQAGILKINAPTTGSEIYAPFGGEKASSGHAAREQGDTAVDFFTRTRTAYIRPGSVQPSA